MVFMTDHLCDVYQSPVNKYTLGACVAQLDEPPTLDFVSGPDLRVIRSSPSSGSMLGSVSA